MRGCSLFVLPTWNTTFLVVQLVKKKKSYRSRLDSAETSQSYFRLAWTAERVYDATRDYCPKAGGGKEANAAWCG
jgi:hypothetical protein